MEQASMSEPLPDTPRWSPWRRGSVNTALVVSILMIFAGAFLETAEAVRLELVRGGQSSLIAVVGIIVFGAGAERGVAWWKGKE